MGNLAVPPAVWVCVCGALYPPQLLLSVESAKVRDCPVPKVPVKLSEEAPPGAQYPPDTVDCPDRVIVPVKLVLPLFVTVRNPESGLAQIVWAVLQPPNW